MLNNATSRWSGLGPFDCVEGGGGGGGGGGGIGPLLFLISLLVFAESGRKK